MTLGPMRAEPFDKLRTAPVEARALRQAQGTSRTKVVGVLVAIALVGISAVGLRLSDPDEKRFEVIRGVPGKPVSINNGEVTVTQVRVGTVLVEYDQIQDRTAGMFVAVSLTGAATGPKPLQLGAARLLSKQVRYDSYRIGAGASADPGFQTGVDVLFEVDPAQIDDLTLEMWPNEVITGYQQRVRIRLGITAGNAAQWHAAARGHAIEPSRSTTRAIP